MDLVRCSESPSRTTNDDYCTTTRRARTLLALVFIPIANVIPRPAAEFNLVPPTREPSNPLCSTPSISQCDNDKHQTPWLEHDYLSSGFSSWYSCRFALLYQQLVRIILPHALLSHQFLFPAGNWIDPSSLGQDPPDLLSISLFTTSKPPLSPPQPC